MSSRLTWEARKAAPRRALRFNFEEEERRRRYAQHFKSAYLEF